MKQTEVLEQEEPLVERFARERQAEIGELRELPLVSLRESPWNPRTYFSDEKLAELADSIKGKGITTPLIVRPTSDGFEIGAGARRYRAAKLAGLNLVPCVVRVLDDDHFLELISFENLQREDPHPLDEAAGFQNYLNHTHCSVEAIAQKTGVSKSQVYARLKLATGLISEAKQACWDGKITAGHAILIARLQPKEQEKALKYCAAENHLYRKPSVRELQDWISSDVCLEMRKAPFDLSDAQLVPDELKGNRTIEGPGSCTACPKRSINSPDLFPELQPDAIRRRFTEEFQRDNPGEPLGKIEEEEIQDRIADADVCTDPGCFHRKLKAHLVKIETQAREKHGEVLKITTGYKSKGDVLGHEQYEVVKGKDASGPNVKTALVVKADRYGNQLEMGQVVQVRIKAKPKQQTDSSPRYGSDEYKAQEAERQRKRDREEKIRLAILEAIGKKATSLLREDVAVLVLGRVDRSGRGKTLLSLHGVKAEKDLEAKIPRMLPAEFARLVVDAGVLDDLHVYDPKEKPEGLLEAAKRYKVDAAKIRSEMEAEFQKQDQPKEPPKSAAPDVQRIAEAQKKRAIRN